MTLISLLPLLPILIAAPPSATSQDLQIVHASAWQISGTAFDDGLELHATVTWPMITGGFEDGEVAFSVSTKGRIVVTGTGRLERITPRPPADDDPAQVREITNVDPALAAALPGPTADLVMAVDAGADELIEALRDPSQELQIRLTITSTAGGVVEASGGRLRGLGFGDGFGVHGFLLLAGGALVLLLVLALFLRHLGRRRRRAVVDLRDQ